MVHSVATGDPVHTEHCAYLYRATVRRDTPSVQELFPNTPIRRGMVRQTISVLRGESQAMRVLGYNIALLELARRLRNHPDVIDKLGTLLDAVAIRPQAGDAANEDLDAETETPEPAIGNHPLAERRTIDEEALADIYQATISTLGRRIQVVGDPASLQNTANANRIRSLLLAGVRSAWLWSQLGGGRWQLVFLRSRLINHLTRLEST